MKTQVAEHLEVHEQKIFSAIEKGQKHARQDFQKWRKKFEAEKISRGDA